MPVDVSSVVREHMSAKWSAHMAAMRRPRPFLQTVALLGLTLAILLIVLVVAVVALVLAVPVGLLLYGWLWMRRMLPTRRVDGRSNVRVINGPASGV